MQAVSQGQNRLEELLLQASVIVQNEVCVTTLVTWGKFPMFYALG